VAGAGIHYERECSALPFAGDSDRKVAHHSGRRLTGEEGTEHEQQSAAAKMHNVRPSGIILDEPGSRHLLEIRRRQAEGPGELQLIGIVRDVVLGRRIPPDHSLHHIQTLQHPLPGLIPIPGFPG
jgi:hypothetical protein